MLTKTKNKSSVAESINPENGLIILGCVEKTRQLTVEKSGFSLKEPELTVNDDEERITLEGDIDIQGLYKKLQECLTKLVGLKTQITPLVEKMLDDLPEFNLDCLVENTQEILANQFGLETIQPKSNYETILDWEYYYCNMRDSSPINEFFRAYWLFMWFEKRANIPMPSIIRGDVPKDKILKYLDTRFSVKYLKEGSTKRDYFYQLYLKVQPYLVRYFSLEKAQQQNLFADELL
jgi:hypothetical protein